MTNTMPPKAATTIRIGLASPPLPNDALANKKKRINQLLEQALPGTDQTPQKLHRAMRYAVLQPHAKRIRPLLLHSIGDTLNIAPEYLDPVACAIELIHIYSLIHDDLPAMDDDDWRRGQATCHIVFDEATAILAGDALQSLAFYLMSHSPNNAISDNCKINSIHKLSQVIGSMGMIGGQSLDLLHQNQQNSTVPPKLQKTIHTLKTAKLIQISLELPVLIYADQNALSNTPDWFTHISQLGEQLGLLFQLQDDLIDQPSQESPTTVWNQSEIENKIQQLKESISCTLQQILICIDAHPHDTLLTKIIAYILTRQH